MDIPGPLERLRNLAAAFREFEAEWVLFRNEELGDSLPAEPESWPI